MACEAVEHLEEVQFHQNLYCKAVEKEAKTHGTFAHSFHSFNPADAEKEINIAFQKAMNHVSVNSPTSIVLIILDENRDLPPLSDLTFFFFSRVQKPSCGRCPSS